MPVDEIKTFEEFRQVIESSTPVIIDFWAPWCGPCKMISPIFEKLADKPEHAGLKFYKVDTDEVERAMQEVDVRVMPSFMVFQNGTKLGESAGAVPQRLADLIKKYAGVLAPGEATAPADAAPTPAAPTPAAPTPAAPSDKL